MNKITRILTAVGATAGMVLAAAAPSYAADDDDDPLSVTITGNSATIAANGFMPAGPDSEPESIAPDITPLSQYPNADPTDGYQAFTGSGQLFTGVTEPGGDRIDLYCVQVLVGHVSHYESVPRDAASIGNAGYVARIVNSAYPTTDVPANYVRRSDKATVVQSAIWYFTDGFVIGEDSTFHNDVVQLVNDTIEAGPVSQDAVDAVPSLNVGLTGPTESVAVGALAGPFTTTAATGTTTFTVDAGGAAIYLDAAGTQLLEPGTPIAVGQQFWVKSDAAGTVTVTADATVRAVSGLYFLGHEGELVGQSVIGATGRPYHATASATATFIPAPPITPTPTPTSTVPALAATGSGDATPFVGFAALFLLFGAASLVMGRRARAAAQPK